MKPDLVSGGEWCLSERDYLRKRARTLKIARRGGSASRPLPLPLQARAIRAGEMVATDGNHCGVVKHGPSRWLAWLGACCLCLVRVFACWLCFFAHQNLNRTMYISAYHAFLRPRNPKPRFNIRFALQTKYPIRARITSVRSAEISQR